MTLSNTPPASCITPEQLQQAVPSFSSMKAAAWAAFLDLACQRFDINTPRRVAAFLAQAAHESQGFTRFSENLNYTTQARLLLIFGRRFLNGNRDPSEFVGKPEALANFVYANRLGNGDEASGDGWRFRGRGIFQLTGRKNYRMCGDGCGFDFEGVPDMLLDPHFGSLAAGWFWKVNGCNELADRQDFIGITQRINGPALAGLEDRQAHWQLARAALGDVA